MEGHLTQPGVSQKHPRKMVFVGLMHLTCIGVKQCLPHLKNLNRIVKFELHLDHLRLIPPAVPLDPGNASHRPGKGNCSERQRGVEKRDARSRRMPEKSRKNPDWAS